MTSAKLVSSESSEAREGETSVATQQPCVLYMVSQLNLARIVGLVNRLLDRIYRMQLYLKMILRGLVCSVTSACDINL